MLLSWGGRRLRCFIGRGQQQQQLVRGCVGWGWGQGSYRAGAPGCSGRVEKLQWLGWGGTGWGGGVWEIENYSPGLALLAGHRRGTAHGRQGEAPRLQPPPTLCKHYALHGAAAGAGATQEDADFALALALQQEEHDRMDRAREQGERAAQQAQQAQQHGGPARPAPAQQAQQQMRPAGGLAPERSAASGSSSSGGKKKVKDKLKGAMDDCTIM